MADRVVAGGEQEPVAVLPLRIVGAEPELVRVDRGEHVGRAEGLANVALALDFAHVQGMVADPVGGPFDPCQAFCLGVGGVASGGYFLC